jgi:hypothetical protein
MSYMHAAAMGKPARNPTNLAQRRVAADECWIRVDDDDEEDWLDIKLRIQVDNALRILCNARERWK